RGERVAMLLPNCFTAVVFDQAALACALTPVPLHAVDTAGSSSYIMNDSQARVLVTAKKGEVGSDPRYRTPFLLKDRGDHGR
ncbi:MAG: AMP-binding protein, partial [Duodenibacillus massiliensis]